MFDFETDGIATSRCKKFLSIEISQNLDKWSDKNEETKGDCL